MITTSLWRFSIGTVATPSHPGGKRALFYRNKLGQDIPVRDYCRRKGTQEPPDRVAFVGPLRYFRQLLCRDSNNGIDPETFGYIRSLPQEARQDFFRQVKHAMLTLVIMKAIGIYWKKTGVILHTFSGDPVTKTVTISYDPIPLKVKTK